jgi:hypothetical protein
MMLYVIFNGINNAFYVSRRAYEYVDVDVTVILLSLIMKKYTKFIWERTNSSNIVFHFTPLLCSKHSFVLHNVFLFPSPK